MTLPPGLIPEPEVVKVIRGMQLAILAEEEAQMYLMADRWLQIERLLEAQIGALAMEIAEKRAAGVVGLNDILQMERYQALLAQAEVEVSKYARWSSEVISGKQREMLRLGIHDAVEGIRWSYKGAGIELIPNFNRLPVGALEAIVGLAGDGSPLVSLLLESYPNAAQGLTNALIRGVTLGKNPRETARLMRDGFGIGLERSLTVARTEQLRAYRFASQEQYTRSGVVEGYKRMASRSGQTCAGCLFSDGEFYPNEHWFDEHPNGRCTLIPVVTGAPEPKWLSSAEWFENQPKDVQMSILGPGRYDAWQNGVSLDRMVTRKHDPVWGGKFIPTPVGELADE